MCSCRERQACQHTGVIAKNSVAFEQVVTRDLAEPLGLWPRWFLSREEDVYEGVTPRRVPFLSSLFSIRLWRNA
jgi:hypothetical protein